MIFLRKLFKAFFYLSAIVFFADVITVVIFGSKLQGNSGIGILPFVLIAIISVVVFFISSIALKSKEKIQ